MIHPADFRTPPTGDPNAPGGISLPPVAPPGVVRNVGDVTRGMGLDDSIRTGVERIVDADGAPSAVSLQVRSYLKRVGNVPAALADAVAARALSYAQQRWQGARREMAQNRNGVAAALGLAVAKSARPARRGGIPLEVATRLLAASLPDAEVELPEILGELLYDAVDLEKGAQHKYIRRVPKPGGGYRYFYTVAGGAGGAGHESELKVGAAFKVSHEGKDGHFHVVGYAGDGKLKIRHDESGHEEEVSREALGAMVRKEHASAIGDHKSKLRANILQAAKTGSAKQLRGLYASAVKHGVDLHDLVPNAAHWGIAAAAIVDHEIGDAVTMAEGGPEDVRSYAREMLRVAQQGGSPPNAKDFKLKYPPAPLINRLVRALPPPPDGKGPIYDSWAKHYAPKEPEKAPETNPATAPTPEPKPPTTPPKAGKIPSLAKMPAGGRIEIKLGTANKFHRELEGAVITRTNDGWHVKWGPAPTKMVGGKAPLHFVKQVLGVQGIETSYVAPPEQPAVDAPKGAGTASSPHVEPADGAWRVQHGKWESSRPTQNDPEALAKWLDGAPTGTRITGPNAERLPDGKWILRPYGFGMPQGDFSMMMAVANTLGTKPRTSAEVVAGGHFPAVYNPTKAPTVTKEAKAAAEKVRGAGDGWKTWHDAHPHLAHTVVPGEGNAAAVRVRKADGFDHVPGVVYGQYAVHEWLGPKGSAGGGHTVTHLPSGKAVAKFYNEHVAHDLARQLAQEHPTWGANAIPKSGAVPRSEEQEGALLAPKVQAAVKADGAAGYPKSPTKKSLASRQAEATALLDASTPPGLSKARRARDDDAGAAPRMPAPRDASVPEGKTAGGTTLGGGPAAPARAKKKARPAKASPAVDLHHAAAKRHLAQGQDHIKAGNLEEAQKHIDAARAHGKAATSHHHGTETAAQDSAAAHAASAALGHETAAGATTAAGGGRSAEGLKVIAIGPKGGKIVGYTTGKDGKQKAIYEGSAAASKLAATVKNHTTPEAHEAPAAGDGSGQAAGADEKPAAGSGDGAQATDAAPAATGKASGGEASLEAGQMVGQGLDAAHANLKAASKALAEAGTPEEKHAAEKRFDVAHRALLAEARIASRAREKGAGARPGGGAAAPAPAGASGAGGALPVARPVAKVVGPPDGASAPGAKPPAPAGAAQPAATPAGAPGAAAPGAKPAPKLDTEALSPTAPAHEDQTRDVGQVRPTTDTQAHDEKHRELQGKVEVAHQKLRNIEHMVGGDMVPMFNKLKGDLRRAHSDPHEPFIVAVVKKIAAFTRFVVDAHRGAHEAVKASVASGRASSGGQDRADFKREMKAEAAGAKLERKLSRKSLRKSIASSPALSAYFIAMGPRIGKLPAGLDLEPLSKSSASTTPAGVLELADRALDDLVHAVDLAERAAEVEPTAVAAARLLKASVDRAPKVDPPPFPNRAEYPYQGRIDFQGIDVLVENLQGTVRKGGAPGQEWSVTMPAHYGEIAGSLGTDGEPIDVFVGANRHAPFVYAVGIRRIGTDGRPSADHDEDKLFLGFGSAAEVEATFRAAYNDASRGLRLETRKMTIGETHEWLAEHGPHGRRVDAGRALAKGEAMAVRRHEANELLVKSGGTLPAGMPAPAATRQEMADAILRASIDSDPMSKGGGPFVGPKGGKWADPQHTIPWQEPGASKPTKQARTGARAASEGGKRFVTENESHGFHGSVYMQGHGYGGHGGDAGAVYHEMASRMVSHHRFTEAGAVEALDSKWGRHLADMVGAPHAGDTERGRPGDTNGFVAKIKAGGLDSVIGEHAKKLDKYVERASRLRKSVPQIADGTPLGRMSFTGGNDRHGDALGAFVRQLGGVRNPGAPRAVVQVAPEPLATRTGAQGRPEVSALSSVGQRLVREARSPGRTGGIRHVRG